MGHPLAEDVGQPPGEVPAAEQLEGLSGARRP